MPAVYLSLFTHKQVIEDTCCLLAIVGFSCTNKGTAK